MVRATPIRSAKTFAKLNGRQRETYQRTLDALSGMRRGQSLDLAAREAGTTPRTVRRYVGAAVKRQGSRYVLGRDRLVRPAMRVLSSGCVERVDGLGRRDSRIAGRHANALKRYLDTGDASELQRLRGASVGGYELETDLDVIDELAARGELEFEDIYELTA
jgi:hypothetical protein